MKNEVKKFSQYINEADDFGAMDPYSSREPSPMGESEVQIDMAAGETLENFAEAWSELAELAPNCVVYDIAPATMDSLEVTIVGPADECDAIAKHWNGMRGGEDIFTRRHGMR